NKKDLKKIKHSCVIEVVLPAVCILGSFGVLSNLYFAIPIVVYKVVHAIGKTHPGGAKSGVSNFLYLCFEALFANVPTMVPPISGTATVPANFHLSLLIILIVLFLSLKKFVDK